MLRLLGIVVGVYYGSLFGSVLSQICHFWWWPSVIMIGLAGSVGGYFAGRFVEEQFLTMANDMAEDCE